MSSPEYYGYYGYSGYSYASIDTESWVSRPANEEPATQSGKRER
jgi:polysaccharide biosynthesis transport protein